LFLFKNNITLNFVKLMATKKDRTTFGFFVSSFFCSFCIQYGRKSRSGIPDKHPVSATLPRILYFSVVQVDRWAAAGWTAGVLCAGSCCFLFFTSLWCRWTGGRQLVGQLVYSVLAAAASYSLLLCGAGRPVGASWLDSCCSLCWQLLLLILDKVRKMCFSISF
jgi:hypothetical protein